MNEVPVLFLIFNRPATTARVFAALREAKPSKLYVAADGPRAHRQGEALLCDEARKSATRVDWPCEIKTLFREENLGCRRAVSGALDWFFANEEVGIVLEDDCLPSPSWFPFAAELLERYRDDTRVMCISATHFHGAHHVPPDSYFFSRYNHCWGWASWRRAWNLYDRDMAEWPRLRDTAWLGGLGGGNPWFASYWRQIFDTAYEGVRVDSWAYRWTFSCWAQSGLTVLPSRNLVSNIGFGDDATHTPGSTAGPSTTLNVETMPFPLRHPSAMARDVWADAWSDRHVFGISIRSALRARLRQVRVLAACWRYFKGMRARPMGSRTRQSP